MFNFADTEPIPTITKVEETSNSRFSCTLATKDNGILTKTVGKDSNGTFFKDGNKCKMTVGTAQTINLDLKDFPEFLLNTNKNQALIHGVPKKKNLNDNYNIVAEKAFNGQDNTITRTLKEFEYPKDTNMLLMVDYDPVKEHDSLTEDQVIDSIDSFMPGYKESAKVISYSTSANIADEKKNVMTGKGAGYHIYNVMASNTNMERFKAIFKTRAINSGYGHILIDSVGKMHVRITLYDTFVHSPERLDFISGAQLPDGWTQERVKPKFIDGAVFDPSLLPDLTKKEITKSNKIVEDLKKEASDTAELSRNLAIKNKTDKLLKEFQSKGKDITRDKAQAIIKASLQETGDLFEDLVLYFDNKSLGAVTVKDVINNPLRFDKETLSDPIDHEEGTGKAIFYANSGKGKNKQVIHSFVHGGAIYFLKEGRPAWIFDEAEDYLNSLDGKNLNSKEKLKVVKDIVSKTLLPLFPRPENKTAFCSFLKKPHITAPKISCNKSRCFSSPSKV